MERMKFYLVLVLSAVVLTLLMNNGWAESRPNIITINNQTLNIRLETMLKRGEYSIKGEEMLKRLKKSGHTPLDANTFSTFWKNQSLIPESWKARRDGDLCFIPFCGTVFRSRLDGSLYVKSLYWFMGGWCWMNYPLNTEWFSNTRLAVVTD